MECHKLSTYSALNIAELSKTDHTLTHAYKHTHIQHATQIVYIREANIQSLTLDRSMSDLSCYSMWG